MGGWVGASGESKAGSMPLNEEGNATQERTRHPDPKTEEATEAT